MQINQVQGPNFGMALVISPEGKKFLQEHATGKVLSELKKSGVKLADTLYWDLKVKADGFKIARKYSDKEYTLDKAVLVPNSSKIDLSLSGRDGILDEYLYYSNAAEAAQAYSKLNSENGVPALTEVINKLDREYGNKMLITDYDTMRAVSRNERIKSEKINDLVSKYGGK